MIVKKGKTHIKISEGKIPQIKTDEGIACLRITGGSSFTTTSSTWVDITGGSNDQNVEIISQVITREYYQKRHKLTAGLVAIWLGSSIAGYIIGGEFGFIAGALIGAVSFFLPPHITRVKETTDS